MTLARRGTGWATRRARDLLPTRSARLKEKPMADKFTLYSPDGRKYVTSDPAEATQLRMASGYSDKAPKGKAEKSEPPTPNK